MLAGLKSARCAVLLLSNEGVVPPARAPLKLMLQDQLTPGHTRAFEN